MKLRRSHLVWQERLLEFYITNLQLLVMKNLKQLARVSILFLLSLNIGFITSIQAQNGWERMTEMPTSRGVFKTVVHNGKIYAIGGIKSVNPPYGISNEVYDTETGEWSVMASMESPRSGLTVEILNNKIYVIGGLYSTSQQSTDILEYDIETDTWTTKCTMPEPRFNHISEIINGKIYIAGGLSVDEYGSHPGLLSSLVYDPVQDHWDTIADLNHERFMGRSCVFDNKIYVFGGAPSGVPFQAAHKSIEIYDPETDVWTISEDEIPVPFMGGMVQVYGDSILLFGGFKIVLDNENYSSIYKYVPGAQGDRWHKLAPMPVMRGIMSGNVIDHYIHMIGGYNGFQNGDITIAQDNHWRVNLDSLLAQQNTGMKEPVDQEIRIFPNPTNALVTIQNREQEIVSMELISPSGRILRKWDDVESPVQVDLSPLPGSAYLIRGFHSDYVTVSRVIKY
jgi:N-acetylneuraminic acid mutarotase